MFDFCCSNNCYTSIVDLYRSCSKCSYELCLSCCIDIHENKVKNYDIEIMQYPYRGKDYMHGESPTIHINKINSDIAQHDVNNIKTDAASTLMEDFDGRIFCPSKEFGGCGESVLELRHLLKNNCVSDLVLKAEKIARNAHSLDKSRDCNCSNTDCLNLRKAASRSDSVDNYLYCPSSRDLKKGVLEHFQKHWMEGEPVIVRDVLENTSSLSWEPMVMWRAMRWAKNISNTKMMKAIDCLANCEVHNIFFYICLFDIIYR